MSDDEKVKIFCNVCSVEVDEKDLKSYNTYYTNIKGSKKIYFYNFKKCKKCLYDYMKKHRDTKTTKKLIENQKT
jgi:hypothetical protein